MINCSMSSGRRIHHFCRRSSRCSRRHMVRHLISDRFNSCLLIMHHHQTGWFNFANEAHMEDVRRRLQAADDNERDGSDSNCSDSVGGGGGGGAFRPTGSGSPKENSKATSASSYPSPNISVGPPIQPPPHLLPYLYPHGIYNHALQPPLSLLHSPAMNPGLFLNAQLALAAQHPALFGHYSGHSPTSPLHNHLKAHRFSPYSLPGFHQGSAFDAVTPGQSNTNSERPPERSLSSSPSHNLNANSNSPCSNRPQSASPTPTNQRPLSQQSSSAFTPQVPIANNNNDRSKNGNGVNNNSTTVHGGKNSTSASELKNMEKMVNGLDQLHQNGNTVPTSLASSGSVRSLSPDDSKKVINLSDQWQWPFTQQFDRDDDSADIIELDLMWRMDLKNR